MILPICVTLVAIVVWSCVAGRLGRTGITLPMAMVAIGVLVGFEVSTPLLENLDHPVAERAVEVLLALLLFLDATEVRASFRQCLGPLVRLVLVGVPLCLGATMLAAAGLLPAISLSFALVLACIVVPTDMAPAAALLKEERIPSRVRDLLNVESGYNDAVVAPVFLFAIALMSTTSDERFEAAAEALADMVPAFVSALLVGLVVGGVCAYAMRTAEQRGWTSAQARRLGMLAVPLLAYALAVGTGGNGFIAAFIAGLAHRAVTGPEEHASLTLTEDVASFATLGLWFVLGQLVGLVASYGVDWRAVVLALLALTVTRVVPLLLVLLGSDLRGRERLLIAWMGPRGVASIVFALLAFPHLDADQGGLALQVVVATVVLSVVLHGVSVGRVAAAWRRDDSTDDAAATAG